MPINIDQEITKFQFRNLHPKISIYKDGFTRLMLMACTGKGEWRQLNLECNS